MDFIYSNEAFVDLDLETDVCIRYDNNTYLRLFIVPIYWHLYSLNRCKKLMFSEYDLYIFLFRIDF